MPADLHRVAEILNDSVPVPRIHSGTAGVLHPPDELSGSQELAIRNEIATKGFYIFTDESGRSFKLVRNETGLNSGASTPDL
jgi:hypothetical protein